MAHQAGRKMKHAIARRLTRLEDLLPEPPPQPTFDYSLLSDELLEAIMEVEGELGKLSEEKRATLEAARITIGASK